MQTTSPTTELHELVLELHEAARRLLQGGTEPRAAGLELHGIADDIHAALNRLEVADASGTGRARVMP